MNKKTANSLLAIESEHGRTSCSDTHPINWYTTEGRGNYPRCTRCALLKAKSDPNFAVAWNIIPARVELTLIDLKLK